MSALRKHARLILAGVCCLAIGAGASAIASAGATSRATTSRGSTPSLHLRALRAHGLRALARRAVHGKIVVRTRNGFVTVTFDRGTIDSVSGRKLKITEGTAQAVYRAVTLTIPAGARIRDNRQPATLAALKPGQRVIVIRAPERTFVFAHTPLAP
jgi:hypothetical protein